MSDIQLNTTPQDLLAQQAKLLISQVISDRAGKAVGSTLEVIGVACSVVEAVSIKLKTSGSGGISGSVKAELAVNIVRDVLVALNNDNLVSSDTFTKVSGELDQVQELLPMVHAVVSIAATSGLLIPTEDQVVGCWKSVFVCGSK